MSGGAYADAVARARELAQRFAMSGGGGGGGSSNSGGDVTSSGPISPGGTNNAQNNVSLKRPYDGDEDDEIGGPKRLASTNGDSAAGVDSKRAAAAAVAAQINQKLGGGSASGVPPSAPNSVNIANVPSVAPQTSIPSLMPTSGSAGPPGPGTGQGQNQGPRPGNMAAQMTIVHAVPDRYVGLIIGKGGEQISRIQSDTGCKVQIAPDAGGSNERSVTLTGTTEQIDRVKDVLRDIITRAEKTTTQFDPTQLPQGQTYTVIGVPGPKVGLIIGKSGETIKHLQEEAGVKMVMIQDTNMPSTTEKPLRITGEPARVEKAKRMVIELLNSKGDRPTPRGPRPPPGHGGPNREQTSYAVPSEKAGLVIGKGGETIKNICAQSGAWVEIQRHTSHDPAIKVFDVSGTQDQIDSAIRMICDRVGTNPPPPMSGGGPHGPHNGPHGYGGGPGGPPGYPGSSGNYGPPSNSHHPYGPPGGHHGPGQSAPPQQPWGGWDQHGSQQSGYGAPPHQQPYGGPQPPYPYGGSQQPRPPAPAPGYPGAPSGPRPSQPAPSPQTNQMPPPTVNPQTGQPDYSAAWIQYYQSLGMHDHANAVAQQAAQQQQQPQQQQHPTASSAPTGAPPQSGIDANKPPGAPAPPNYGGYGGPPPPSSAAAPTSAPTPNSSNAGSGQQDYAAQWQQYSQQWQAWQQQQQQWQEWQQQQQPKN